MSQVILNCEGNPGPKTCTGSECTTFVSFGTCLQSLGIMSPKYDLKFTFNCDVGELQIIIVDSPSVLELGILVLINDEVDPPVYAAKGINNDSPTRFISNFPPAGLANPVAFDFQYQDSSVIIVYTINFNCETEPGFEAQATIKSARLQSNVVSAFPPNFNQPSGYIPNIQILASLNDNATEIFSATMTIRDIYEYRLCRYCLCKQLVDIPTDSTITILHPDFYPVIKQCCEGVIACNLKEKLELALKCTKNPPNANANSITNYALLVYFFSALLYGCFNIDLLCRINYNKFIKNLNNSRFNNFSKLFTDPQFGLTNLQRYFIC